MKNINEIINLLKKLKLNYSDFFNHNLLNNKENKDLIKEKIIDKELEKENEKNKILTRDEVIDKELQEKKLEISNMLKNMNHKNMDKKKPKMKQIKNPLIEKINYNFNKYESTKYLEKKIKYASIIIELINKIDKSDYKYNYYYKRLKNIIEYLKIEVKKQTEDIDESSIKKELNAFENFIQKEKK